MRLTGVKNLIRKFDMFAVFAASFLYALPVYNKYWNSFDEGFILEAAYMTTRGMTPYRDFFLLLYPPGQIYALAGLMKIFGANLIVGRIYTIFLQAVICTCVFFIVKKMTSRRYGLIASVVCLSTLAANGGPIPSTVWPGVTFSLITTALLLNFIYGGNNKYLFLSGFFAALTLFCRHEIGLVMLILGLIVFPLYALCSSRIESLGFLQMLKRSIGYLLRYALFPFLFVAVTVFLFYRAGALEDAVQSLLIFPMEFCKGAALPLPAFCFNPNMIFHRGCLFITNNQFYIPALLCGMSSILILLDFISTKKLNKKLISWIAILLLAVSYLPQIMARTDMCHLSLYFAPSAILFGLIFIKQADARFKIYTALKIVFISFASILMVLFVYKNVETYLKSVFIKPYVKKSVEPVKFKQGTIYVPKDEAMEIELLMEYVEKNTSPDDKIYIGSLNHSVPHFGGHDIIYFLSGRLPAVKYYELHPGLQDREEIQKDMIADLKANGANVLLLKDFKDKTARLGVLDNFIRSNYRIEKVIGRYNIYVKK